MRALIPLAAAAAATVVAWQAPASAQDAEPVRIVVVTHGQASDPFWSVVKNGVDQAQKDTGATVEYRAPDTFDMVQMAQLIDAAVASQPNGLVVSVPDADALRDSIQAAVDAGIAVISTNSGADVHEELGIPVHVGQTEREAGFGAGERMKEAGVTKALCVNQEVGNISLDLRCEGFTEGLGGEVEVLSVSMDPTEVRSAVEAKLGEESDVDGVLALGPSGAEPTMAALEAAGNLEAMQFGTFDLSPAVLEAIRDGKMDFAIDQQQFMQGYLPVSILALNAKYGLMPASDILTGPGFVTQENAERVIDLSSRGIR